MAPSETARRKALAARVDDMFDYLATRNYVGTIECQPEIGTESLMLELVLDRAREEAVCVHATFQHGWMMFHAHRTGSTVDVPLPHSHSALLPWSA